METSVLKNSVRAARSVLSDLEDLFRYRIGQPVQDLTPQELECLETLRRDGVCVLEGFWSRDQVDAIRSQLEGYQDWKDDCDLEGGAYLRVRTGTEYDEGIRRIYHVDRLIEELREFRFDPLPLRVATAYYRIPFYSGLLMHQYNPASTHVTRTFHVDCFSKEFKSFLYLDDVDMDAGPFTYLKGSHRRHLLRLRKRIVGNSNDPDTTFYERDIGDVRKMEFPVCGTAGTLVLADVRGLHRGSPQRNRARSVLVNYIVREEGDLELDR